MQVLYRTVEAKRNLLFEIAGDTATHALLSYPDEAEKAQEDNLRGAGEAAASEAAFIALHSGWNEDAAWGVAERAAKTAVREYRATL
ncbi:MULTISPECIES: hypothetical protein [unclassified Sulfitobacter]|uniref:hypothetical protein n=1 Tax=unclassified Sulfitobacter TaxID=196795 RepID=UPI003745769D